MQDSLDAIMKVRACAFCACAFHVAIALCVCYCCWKKQEENMKLVGVGEEFVKQKQRIVKAETDAIRYTAVIHARLPCTEMSGMCPECSDIVSKGFAQWAVRYNFFSE